MSVVAYCYYNFFCYGNNIRATRRYSSILSNLLTFDVLFICFLFSAPQPREIVIVGGRRVPISELVRRRGDIARLDPKHPARPLIFRCISDDPSSRPSATELYQELRRIQHLFVGTDKVNIQQKLL